MGGGVDAVDAGDNDRHALLSGIIFITSVIVAAIETEITPSPNPSLTLPYASEKNLLLLAPAPR